MIERPIFVLGNIRSGTTILYNLVAAHPDTCWFTYRSDAKPSSNSGAASLRWLDVPVVGPAQRRAIIANRPSRITMHWLPWPSEGDRIYHEYCGFGKQRDGLETELTAQMEQRLKTVIENHQQVSGRTRFLSKQTANNRRLDLLDRMFPDAIYIHIIRDGRAVTSSMLREPWWPATHVWWLGRKAGEWQPDFRDAAELAAKYWQKTVEVVREFGTRMGDRYMEVRYHELTEDPVKVVHQILEQTGLSPHASYVNMLPRGLSNSNHKWKSNLTPRQQEIVVETIGAFLRDLGYAV